MTQDADFVEHLEAIRDRCKRRTVTADDGTWLLMQLDDYMESLGTVISQRNKLLGISDDTQLFMQQLAGS